MDTGLSFPGSEERQEIEFRDGKRLVPPHLEPLLRKLETHRMTYEEAVAIANQKMEADFINRKAEGFIAEHFRRGPG